MDRADGHLRGPDGEDCELRHQTREVLLMLAKSPEAVISKSEFFETVWDGAHVSEDSLVQCIAEIRQAIDDKDKTLVQTIPRKGYRLVPTPDPKRTRMQPIHWATVAVLSLAVVLTAIWVTRPTVGAPRVVAVLPFADDSPETGQGTLGDVISAGVRANLARYPELTVIARNSSQRFRGDTHEISEIGKTLGARYVLEGSQHLDGRQLRVTAQLIDATDNTHVWSDQIDTEIDDMLNVTAQIGERVAHAVEAFVSSEQAKIGGKNEVDALLLNHKSRQTLLGGPSREKVEAAIAINRASIRRYPEEAWGHIGLAFSLRTQLRFGWAEDSSITLQEAINHAQKAVSLAPENYAAHFALARVRMQQGNQIAAIEAFERAIVLNPSSADALNALAQSQFYLGQNERALEALARSERIDPLPSFIHSWMSAWVLWQDHRCEEALKSFSRLSAPPPEAHKLLATIHMCLGEDGKATKALRTFLAKEPDWTASQEKELHEAQWIADGSLHRWLDDLKRSGLSAE